MRFNQAMERRLAQTFIVFSLSLTYPPTLPVRDDRLKAMSSLGNIDDAMPGLPEPRRTVEIDSVLAAMASFV
jgi:hypothetical protein